MKPKDIFGLAVRILGLFFLYHGLTLVPEAVETIFSGVIGNIIWNIFAAGYPLLIAYWLLRGAPLLMDIAYPE